MDPSSEHPDDVDVLAQVPAGARARELWMQHAIGYVLMGRMREYAASRIPVDASPEARELALVTLDRALFGLMEECDGFVPPLANDTHVLSVDVVGTLRRFADDEVVTVQALGDGDGACIGVHGWLAGDFGDVPPVERVREFAAQSEGFPG